MDTNQISENTKWELVKQYLNQDVHDKNKFLIRHQIDSYTDFIENYIHKIIQDYNPVVIRKDNVEFSMEVYNPRLTKAYYKDINGDNTILTPNKALEKNLTYSVSLLVDIKYYYKILNDDKIEDFKQYQEENIKLAQIPLMIGSKFCMSNLNNSLIKKNPHNFENGGFFIINGTEKVIISQERMRDNKPYIFKQKSDKKYSYSCEVRSNKHISQFSQSFALQFISESGIQGKCTINFSFPHIKPSLPLFLLFKYFGIKNDRDIIRMIIGNNQTVMEEYWHVLEPSIREYRELGLSSEEEIKQYFSKYRTNQLDIDLLVRKDIFPHLGDDFNAKAHYLAMMVKKLLDVVIGKQEVSDRDHFQNKRVETPGILLSQLFRILYEDLTREIKNNVIKEMTKNVRFNITRHMKKSNIITSGIRFALATGNWNVKTKNNKKVGVAQVLNRLTYSSTLSHSRQINAPIAKSAKIVVPRKLHNSQFFNICCCESPEGSGIGLIKNLALSSFITCECDENIIYHHLIDKKITLLKDINLKTYESNSTKILLNGKLIGIYDGDSVSLITYLREKRRKLFINPEISIYFNYTENEIYVSTDAGRISRPLFCVKNNQVLFSEDKNIESWKEMIKGGYIEYIDVEESENCMIAMTEKDLRDNPNINYTHCEIHPALMLGICASLIPLPNHNQSPRNIYQSAMGKQAIGLNSVDSLNRMETSSYILNYPQRPLVSTKAAEILGFNEFPAGKNITVAIMSHTGYNLEDSVILNRSSLERGLFNITTYKTYKLEEKKDMSAMTKEMFCIPNEADCIQMKNGAYDKLGTDGIARIGECVTGKDVIIGKMTPVIERTISSKKDMKYQDTSLMLKHNETGVIDKTLITYNADEYRLAKVRVRSYKIPVIGDKFATRQAQKGTCGMILNEEDMPFMEDGTSPDLIINPHALPSRMTIAMVLEAVMGKIGSHEDSFSDGTPFTDIDMESYKKQLEKYGFDYSGKEILYNGETGHEINTQIFTGPIFYQRLKHLVDNKVHSRTTGPVSIMTRQPVEGRVREGGFRVGEMELQSLISHGMAGFMKEKIFDCSDAYECFICNCCGMIAECNEDEQTFRCISCESSTEFSKINLPYATKLFLNTLMAMNIVPRINK